MSDKIDKAKKFKNSGFLIVGYGYFDITDEELAIVIDLLKKDDFDSLKFFYEQLSEEKL